MQSPSFRAGDVHYLFYNGGINFHTDDVRELIEKHIRTDTWLCTYSIAEMCDCMYTQQRLIQEKLLHSTCIKQPLDRELYHRGLILKLSTTELENDTLKNSHCRQQKALEAAHCRVRTRSHKNQIDLPEGESDIERCVYLARRYAMTLIIPIDITQPFWDEYDCLPRDWPDFIHFRNVDAAIQKKTASEYIDVPQVDLRRNASYQTFHGFQPAIEIDLNP